MSVLPTHQKSYPLQLFKFIFKISICQFKNVWRGYIIFQNYFRKYMRQTLKAAFSRTRSVLEPDWVLRLEDFTVAVLQTGCWAQTVREMPLFLTIPILKSVVLTSSQGDIPGAQFHWYTSSWRPDEHLKTTCLKTVCLVVQWCQNLCDSMDWSLPDSSVHGDTPGKNAGVGCH